MPFLGIFGLEFLKTIVIFEINTLKFVIIESLTRTVNFGIGSAFSKGPESAFSEGLGPGPGLLYKVWPMKQRYFYSSFGTINIVLQFYYIV